MSKTRQAINAKDITLEEQLNKLLESCGIASQSPKDVEWLSHWWKKEFEPNSPPIARHFVLTGIENFAPSLCLAIDDDKFVVYMLNERDYWFASIGEADEFSSTDELKKYLKNLVDQYFIN